MWCWGFRLGLGTNACKTGTPPLNCPFCLVFETVSLTASRAHHVAGLAGLIDGQQVPNICLPDFCYWDQIHPAMPSLFSGYWGSEFISRAPTFLFYTSPFFLKLLSCVYAYERILLNLEKWLNIMLWIVFFDNLHLLS